ncbi:MAG: tripartite tricarboxylate transporter substrate-binding protein [Janthinobacterium lividum]
MSRSYSHPGKLNFGIYGIGTGLHVTAEMIKQQVALYMVHAPCESGPQVLTELADGQIDLAVLPVALVQTFIPRRQGPRLRRDLAPALGHAAGRAESVGDDRTQVAGHRTPGKACWCPRRPIRRWSSRSSSR